jgi:hypothetical protein
MQFFFYDVYKRGTNLEVILKVILNEIHCKECTLQVLEQNFKIDRIKADILIVQIKFVN